MIRRHLDLIVQPRHLIVMGGNVKRWLTLTTLLLSALCASNPVAADDGRDAHARRAFRAAELRAPTHFSVVVSSAETIDAFVAITTQAVAVQADQARAAADRFDTVLAMGMPYWSVAAMVAQAQIYERLAAGYRAYQLPPSLAGHPLPPVERFFEEAAQRAQDAADTLYARAAVLATDRGVRSEAARLAMAHSRTRE